MALAFDEQRRRILMIGNTRSLIALALTVALLVHPATVLASEEGTAAEGALAGQGDGRSNTDGKLWLGVGCLLHAPGLAAAYLYSPSPPATSLLGKSPEYVAAYTDAYSDAAKKVQANSALIGCVASSLALVGYYFLLRAALSEWF
jgi:hypothetical protein